MTNSELYTALASIPGYANKVAFRAFPEPAPALPYIVYLPTISRNCYADDRVYAAFTAVQIELYTTNKDEAQEAAVEAKLSALSIPYEKSETYIDTEQCYEVLYEITI